MKRSKHAQRRMQQRALDEGFLMLASKYGQVVEQKGGTFCEVLGHRVAARAQAELEAEREQLERQFRAVKNRRRQVRKQLKQCKSAFAVYAAPSDSEPESKLITVAHHHGKVRGYK